jgi:hypothetical protein
MKSVTLTIRDTPDTPVFDAKVSVDDVASFAGYQVILKSGRVLKTAHTRTEIEGMLGRASTARR